MNAPADNFAEDRSGGSGGRIACNPTSRRFVALVGLLVVVGMGAVAFLVAALMGVGACGGDGGSPYSAPASPLGGYCQGPLGELSILTGLGLGLIGVILGAIQRSWRRLFALTVTGLLLIVSPLVFAATLSPDCSDSATQSASRCHHH
jgi:hypothetical protein